jgi:hypothetical protein
MNACPLLTVNQGLNTFWGKECPGREAHWLNAQRQNLDTSLAWRSLLRALDWPGRTTLQQDPSAHVYWESLIVEAKRPRAQNWCCFYRPRRGVSHTRIGYALSLICMFLVWLATLSQYLTEPHYHAPVRQCLCKKLYCIYTHWLFVQTYAWWPAVVSATLQRHIWLPTGVQGFMLHTWLPWSSVGCYDCMFQSRWS